MATTDEHPVELLAEAEDLEREAGELWARVKELRGRAAGLRERAKRRVQEAEAVPVRRPRPEPPDPLLSAAALAVEDLRGEFTTHDLAEVLEIPDERAGKILARLVEMELVMRVGMRERNPADRKWRSVDPTAARVRDAAKDMDRFTVAQLARKLAMHPQELAYYLAELRIRGAIEWWDDGHYQWAKVENRTRPGFEHETKTPPEKLPPAGTESRAQGKPIRLVHAGSHGKRGKAMSQPGVRHRIKMKDLAWERMEAAKAARAEEQRAKTAANGGNPKRTPRKRNRAA